MGEALNISEIIDLRDQEVKDIKSTLNNISKINSNIKLGEIEVPDRTVNTLDEVADELEYMVATIDKKYWKRYLDGIGPLKHGNGFLKNPVYISNDRVIEFNEENTHTVYYKLVKAINDQFYRQYCATVNLFCDIGIVLSDDKLEWDIPYGYNTDENTLNYISSTLEGIGASMHNILAVWHIVFTGNTKPPKFELPELENTNKDEIYDFGYATLDFKSDISTIKFKSNYVFEIISNFEKMKRETGSNDILCVKDTTKYEDKIYG